MPLSLSIVVPTRNEEAIIATCLRALVNELPDAEILVVDGGSDGTEGVVQQMAQRHPRIRHIRNEGDRGKGHAIRTGILAARGECVVQFDGDLQFLASDIPRLIAPIEANQADLVLGSRFTRGSRRSVGSTPWLRRMGNLAVSAYASALCGHRMTDVLAGIKAWRREVSDAFFLTSDSFTYEAEIPIKALRCGYRVCDLAVGTEPRTTGESSVNVWKTGLALLRDLPRFRLFPLEVR